MKDSPEASLLLTLHNINKMLPEIYKVVVFQLNKTRKVPGGKLWKHGSEASLTMWNSRGRVKAARMFYLHYSNNAMTCTVHQQSAGDDSYNILLYLSWSMIIKRGLQC